MSSPPRAFSIASGARPAVTCSGLSNCGRAWAFAKRLRCWPIDQALPRPTHVDGDQVNEFGQADVQGIRSLLDNDARVLAQAPGQRAIGRVDGVDLRGAALEQAIDESSDVAAQIGTRPSRRVDAELVERRGQLDAAAGNEGVAGQDSVTPTSSRPACSAAWPAWISSWRPPACAACLWRQSGPAFS